MEATVAGVCELLVRTRLLSADEVRTLTQRWLREAGLAAADIGQFGKSIVVYSPYHAAHLAEHQIGLLAPNEFSQRVC